MRTVKVGTESKKRKVLEVVMKKLIFVFFALFTVFGVTAFADEAVVVAVSGKVEVSSGGDWKALSVGQKVGTGDTISTGFKSSLTLEYKTANQSSTMELGPLTRISFDELVSNGDTDNVQLAMRGGQRAYYGGQKYEQQIELHGKKSCGYCFRARYEFCHLK